jgi:hypothetical protein
MPPPSERATSRRPAVATAALLLLLALAGCSGEPSPRELRNRQEFEALLTAVALKDASELEKDARRIDGRHDAGELSDGSYRELRAIIDKARSGDWSGAEKQAYAFRESTPYFP